MQSSQWECRLAVVERNNLPFCWLMTGSTAGPKLALVNILRSMAGDAILWRTFENIVHVARLAGDRCMCAAQREGSLAVIEDHLQPFRGFVARRAVLAELSIMNIFGGMA